MTIGAVVRNEAGADLSPFVEFQNIVPPERANLFPMLAHIDPYGNTILNRLQVDALKAELEQIKVMIEDLGIDAAISAINIPDVPVNSRIPEWDTVRALVPLLDAVEGLAVLALERPHRYLWFIGD